MARLLGAPIATRMGMPAATDNLVDRVVTTDVLPQKEHAAAAVKESRSVESTRPFEYQLSLAQRLAQTGQDGRVDGRTRREALMVEREGGDGRGAADAAGRAAEEAALRAAEHRS